MFFFRDGRFQSVEKEVVVQIFGWHSTPAEQPEIFPFSASDSFAPQEVLPFVVPLLRVSMKLHVLLGLLLLLQKSRNLKLLVVHFECSRL